jgi:hypothetical protein
MRELEKHKGEPHTTYAHLDRERGGKEGEWGESTVRAPMNRKMQMLVSDLTGLVQEQVQEYEMCRNQDASRTSIPQAMQCLGSRD